MCDHPPNCRGKHHVSPKVTNTTITIVKSTPFFIRRHHLDDSQMRQALQYDSQLAKKTTPRSYSYKGEVRTCMNSKLGDTQRTNRIQPKQPTIKQRISQYYQPANQVIHSANNININQKPKMKTSATQRGESKQSNQNNKAVQINTQRQQRIGKQIKKRQNYNVTKIFQNPIFQIKIDAIPSNPPPTANDYGLKQNKTTNKKSKLHEAQKMRKKHEKMLKEDLMLQQKRMNTLQQEIDDLRIKNLQLQRKGLKAEMKSQLGQKNESSVGQKIMKWSIQSLRANKPKFWLKHKQRNDTDSSFSSFQLS